jgi:hypothetical protein
MALKRTAIDPAPSQGIPKEILTPKKPRSFSENRKRPKVSPQQNELLYFQSDKVSLDAK